MEKVNLIEKRNLIGALIVVMSLIVIGISGSYAYYVNRVETAEGSDKHFKVTSGVLDMEFATGGQTLNVLEAGLIDGGVDNAEFAQFTIQFNSNAKNISNATYDIYLMDVEMTDNFKSEYVRWALYDAEGGSPICNGNFNVADLKDKNAVTPVKAYNDIKITTESKSLTKGNSATYKLFVWLQNDPNKNQADKSGAVDAIDLTSGSLSFKIGFRAKQA